MSKSLRYSNEVKSLVERSMSMVENGKIRDHKLRNKAREHTDELEEQECNLYCDFLPSKNCAFVLNLIGCDNDGEY